MIKAKELRIGNLVNSLENEQIIINGIFEAGVHNQDFNGYPYEMLKPIPLTEEWLLKFKFNLDNGFYHLDDFWISNFYENYFTLDGFDECKIKHVHQL